MVCTKGRLHSVTSTVVLIGILIFLTTAVGCIHGWEMTSCSPLGPERKGNPKLDSQLNQLIDAERRGEASLFARRNNIELVDGSVRVIIECVPEEVVAATAVATALGASVEARYRDLLQALVPIANLTALADAPTIRLIRLPREPVAGVD